MYRQLTHWHNFSLSLAATFWYHLWPSFVIIYNMTHIGSLWVHNEHLYNCKNSYTLTHTHTHTHILASLVAQMVKNLPANAVDMGLIPGLGRSPGEGNGYPLQYSWLENPMDRGAWQAPVHGITKSRHYWATNTLTHNNWKIHRGFQCIVLTTCSHITLGLSSTCLWTFCFFLISLHKPTPSAQQPSTTTRWVNSSELNCSPFLPFMTQAACL